MNVDEARDCCAVLIAGYPAWRPEEGTIVLLADSLSRFEFETGLAACRWLVETDDRSTPTTSRVIAACQTEARRRAPKQRALPVGEQRTRREVALARVAELRAQLAAGKPAPKLDEEVDDGE